MEHFELAGDINTQAYASAHTHTHYRVPKRAYTRCNYTRSKHTMLQCNTHHLSTGNVAISVRDYTGAKSVYSALLEISHSDQLRVEPSRSQ